MKDHWETFKMVMVILFLIALVILFAAWVEFDEGCSVLEWFIKGIFSPSNAG